MTKIKEDALKEPRKVSDGGRDIRSNYLFCPTLCRSCNYFVETESNWPYKCSQGTSDNIANRSQREGYRQYDKCKYYKEKESPPAVNTLRQETNRKKHSISQKSQREIEQEEEAEQKREEGKQRLQEYWKEREYNDTHCLVCHEKGELIELHNYYFHQNCLETFKNSEKGKEWINKQIIKENETKVLSIVEKYGNDFWEKNLPGADWKAGIRLFLEYAGITKEEAYHALYGRTLYLDVDIDKFSLFVENKYNNIKAGLKAAKGQERQKNETEEQAKLEAENKLKEAQIKKHLYRRTQLPFFIVGTIITLFFNDTLLLSLDQIRNNKFIPVIMVVVMLAVYSGLLKAVMSSGYETINGELQKGNRTGKFGKFIVYAGLGLVATAIHGGIVFFVMHILLKLW